MTRGRLRSRPRAAWISAGAACAIVAVGALVTSASAGDPAADTLGKTTVEQKLGGNGDPEFQRLSLGPGEGYVVREEGIGTAAAGRQTRRESLLYFGQLSDFQLADEESPARVEFLDFGPFSSAWRQNEAFLAHQAEAMVRQLNAFAPASPVTAGDGSRRAMDFTINTGDAADSQQLNETEWVRTLAEGGTLTPGSGVNPVSSGDPLCAVLGTAGLIADGANPGRYTGVQDFDDFLEGPIHQYYDPDQPSGAYAAWPAYPGLMNAAQAPFAATGLDVPHYLTFGNHDALVQGNAAANVAYEAVATGCVKPMSPLTADVDTLQEALANLDPVALIGLITSDPTKIALVPPDPRRQFVSKQQYKQVFLNGQQADGHGFGFIDSAQDDASNGAAGYYSWSPEPGMRFISVDTVSEGGVIGPSSDGNVDHPQFQWLTGELAAAAVADELVVLFSHHAIPSLTADVPDEAAPPCLVNDPHGHDLNPGCDLDPRSSQPIHLGGDLEALLHAHPNVVAWVAGHSHQNSIDAFPKPGGEGGFWSIRVAAEADWPMQSRLLEIFDNQDGTLSIFGTLLDLAAPAAAVPPGTDAAGLDAQQLASIGRTIGFNETQYGAETCNPTCEGQPADRNVELLVDDPREDGGPGPEPGPCEEVIRGTQGPDRLSGTAGSERIAGRRGGDRINGLGGDDCIQGARGNDRLKPGDGEDKVRGGKGRDRVRAADGVADVIRCGRGKRDRVFADQSDRLRGCERVRYDA